MTHSDIIDRAIQHLRDGRDVVIVALYPADTFRIADDVRATADLHAIPCALSEHGANADVPLIVARPYLWPAVWTPKFRARPIVMVDQSAILERPCYVPPKYRKVECE
jgi:hypothetical protein